MSTNGSPLRVVTDGETVNPSLARAVWDAADVAAFFHLPSVDMARRRIAKLEKGGAALRVPEAIAGRKTLVYAHRLLQAAGMSEAEIRAALSSPA